MTNTWFPPNCKGGKRILSSVKYAFIIIMSERAPRNYLYFHVSESNLQRSEATGESSRGCPPHTAELFRQKSERLWWGVWRHRGANLLKEELHNRFNSISEERVNIFKHNSENLMKIGWKVRKLWHFKEIFKKYFLTSRYEYADEWGDDVIASQFSIHFVHRNDTKIHISAMRMLDLP